MTIYNSIIEKHVSFIKNHAFFLTLYKWVFYSVHENMPLYIRNIKNSCASLQMEPDIKKQS